MHILNCIVLCVFLSFLYTNQTVLILLLLCDYGSDVSLWYTFTNTGEPQNLQLLFRSHLPKKESSGQKSGPKGS